MDLIKRQADEKQGNHLLGLPQELLLLILDSLLDDALDSLEAGYEAEEMTHEFSDDQKDPVFHDFDAFKDIAHLAATCRELYTRVTPILYKEDVIWNFSSALLLSAKSGNASAMLKSLDSGADVNEIDATEFSYYDLSTCRPGPPIPCVVRKPNEMDITSLHLASYHCHVDCVALLLERGADPDCRGEIRYNRQRRFEDPSIQSFYESFYPYLPYSTRPSPYGTMIKLGRAPILQSWTVNFLHDGSYGQANALYYTLADAYKPFSTGRKDKFDEEECLRRQENRLVTARLLLKAGVSPITHLKSNLNALHQVCGNVDLASMAILLKECNISANVRDVLWNTPLHYVAMSASIHVDRPRDLGSAIQLLLRHGAKIDAVNLEGMTPLEAAFRKQFGTSAGVMIAFLENGARVPSDLVSDMVRCRWKERSIRRHSDVEEAIISSVESRGVLWAGLEATSEKDREDARARAVCVALYVSYHEHFGIPMDGKMLRWDVATWELYWRQGGLP